MDVMDAVNHKVVSETEWVEAHKAFLAKEKELTRQRDELSRQRRELPWVKVAQEYIFDGPHGRRTLADLFDGRSQLTVYHFMFGPEWVEGCRVRGVVDVFRSQNDTARITPYADLTLAAHFPALQFGSWPRRCALHLHELSPNWRR
jgi:predicted dithiol-disulfide oxidoreductase (DUF899 family)